MMKGYTVALLFSALLLACIPMGVRTAPALSILEFDFEGLGNVVLDSPPEYSGDITAGDPLVVGGTWWIRMDDSAWPDPVDPAARWNYIFSHHFVYDPMSFSWTAVFDAASLPAKPTWEINHPSNGTMGGTLVIVITFSDWDMDGVLDLEERTFGVFSGTLIVMKYGTGYFANYCGEGSYNGALNNADPANWAPDFVEGHCILLLEDCSIGTQQISWGGVKALYR